MEDTQGGGLGVRQFKGNRWSWGLGSPGWGMGGSKGLMVLLGTGLGMDPEEDETSTPTRLFQ